MQKSVQSLLLLSSILGGLLLAVPSAEARDHGRSHDGGGSHNGGTIIFIPPGDGGGGDHMRNGGGSDSYIRHRDDGASSNIGRRQSSTGEFSRPSNSQEFIYRKRRLEGKKPDGEYGGMSKWRRADDFDDHEDDHKHKRYHKRHGKFRHYYAGWWYLDPWWTYGLAPYYADRLSCAEARRIVEQRYKRVRTIECNGRIYTFRAVNSRGRLIEVSVNSVTGAYWRS